MSSTAEGTPTVIDLFAGCGGGSLGFGEVGFRVAAAVEIDSDAADAFKRNVGTEPLIDDIRDVTGERLLETADLGRWSCTLMFGCPPCQSFTIMRRGASVLPQDRVRNTLPDEYVRLIDAVRPRHLAFENVPGMLSGRWRPRFDTMLGELQALGYKLVHEVVDAADFGVPQHRRRVLVIGSRVASPRMPDRTHAADATGDAAQVHVTVRQTIGDLPSLGAGERDPEDEFHRARRHSDLNLRRLRAVPEGGGRMDLPPELRLRCHDGHQGHYDVYGRMWWDKPSPTLTSGCTNITRGRFGHPDQDRAITVREAMLLQTFPEKAVVGGHGEKQALQVGNAVPPKLAAEIGRCVLAMEAESLACEGSGRGSRTAAN